MAKPPAFKPSPQLIAHLKASEGRRLSAYPDPESEFARTGKGSKEPWTIGWGHTGPDVCEGRNWTPDQANAALLADIATAAAQCDAHVPWWRTLDQVRQEVVLELMFNMGWGDGTRRLSSFTNTLGAIQRRDFKRAAAGLMASRWAVQVGRRANRIAQQLASGEQAP